MSPGCALVAADSRPLLDDGVAVAPPGSSDGGVMILGTRVEGTE